MNKLHQFWYGKKLRDIYPYAKWYQVIFWKLSNFFRKVFILLGICLIVTVAFLAGGKINPSTVYINKETQVVQEVDRKAPVLERIADCETGTRTKAGKAIKGTARQFGPSGQVMMTANKNMSVDVGKYAINTVWFKQATELHLDLTKEADNKTMAEWIYENRGTGDWYSSQSCWAI